MFPLKKSATLILLVLAAAVPSCNDSGEPDAAAKNDNNPIGVWKIDSEATLTANQTQIATEIEKVPKAKKAEARTKLEEMFKSVEGTMEFHPDNTLASTTIFNGEELTSQGTWEIDGDVITTRVPVQNSEQVSTGVIKEGFLSLSPDQKQFVVLKRN